MDKPIPEAVRAAFEAYIRKESGDISTFGRPPHRHYRNSYVNHGWLGWQEGMKYQAALTAAQQPDHIVDATKMVAQQQRQAVAWRSEVERAIERARVFDDGSDGADSESAQSVVAILTGLLNAQPMQQGGGETIAGKFDRKVLNPMRVADQRTAPPSAPVGVEGLPQPFGYVEPRHDLSGYEVFDEPGPRRAAIWNMHGMRKALAQTRAPYSIDTDADGVRARVADAITGALAFGAQGTHKPPAGHWLEPFWDMARADAAPPSAPMVDEATARRLDDYLGGEFDIRIGKQAAHAALCHALAQQPAAVDEARVVETIRKALHHSYGAGHTDYVNFTEALDFLATQHQEPTT